MVLLGGENEPLHITVLTKGDNIASVLKNTVFHITCTAHHLEGVSVLLGIYVWYPPALGQVT